MIKSLSSFRSSENILTISHLSFAFADQAIFTDLSLAISAGKCVALMGPSGSGKTTLMRLIAELLPAQVGEITVNGEPKNRMQDITYLMQDDLLLPWKNVLQNIVLFSSKDQQVEAEQLIDALCIRHLLGHFPNQLSGGQRKRVALARALLTKRSLLILDEPFVFLDTQLKEKIFQILRNRQSNYRLSILMITHDLHEVLQMADRAVFLYDGKITRELDLSAMKTFEELSEEYRGIYEDND